MKWNIKTFCLINLVLVLHTSSNLCKLVLLFISVPMLFAGSGSKRGSVTTVWRVFDITAREKQVRKQWKLFCSIPANSWRGIYFYIAVKTVWVWKKDERTWVWGRIKGIHQQREKNILRLERWGGYLHSEYCLGTFVSFVLVLGAPPPHNKQTQKRCAHVCAYTHTHTHTHTHNQHHQQQPNTQKTLSSTVVGSFYFC